MSSALARLASHVHNAAMVQPLQKMTLDAYLAWEAGQADKNEFYQGDVYAMVGARRVHGLVTGNVFAAIKRQIKGSPCLAFVEGMKVQANANSVFYPDVFVTCDAADLKTDYLFKAPIVVVEVLSDSTQAFDRGLKFAAYRQIAALKEYVLIDPDTRVIEVYRRGADGLFTLNDFTNQARFDLTSIQCELAAADVFEGAERV